MKISCLLLTLLIAGQCAFSQDGSIIKESWDANPTLHNIPSKLSSESAIVLRDKRRVEYVDEGKDGLMMYRTLHKIIHVNDDKGIEAFNTIYLGVSNSSDIVDIKARTILPSKKIIEIDRKNIKDIKDEDGSQYKIFALEGLEKGCEVEYYYTYKAPSTFFGREILQGAFPISEASIEIVSPERLVFEHRLYNGTESGNAKDTVLNSKRISSIQSSNIEGVEEEKYAAYKGNLQRLEYKLSYNLSRSANEKLFSWNELAKRIYEIYTSFSDKEMKKVQSLVSDNKWDKLGSEKEKIVAVENYLKKNIGTREDIEGEDAENIEKILKNKIASYRGIIRLYGAVFKALGIEVQFVLTGDRQEYAVDKSFENWNNTENPVLYFPSQKKFMAPTRMEMRYPWIEPNWAGTNGLFCKATTIGSFTSALAEVKQIPLENYKESCVNLDADLSLNNAMDTMMVDMKQILKGYPAYIYRASFNFSSAEQQRLIIKEMVKSGTNSENIVSSNLVNQDYESYSENKPFILEAKVKSSELIEKAGNKVLVKVGEVIGRQVEMYQEKPRRFPMEIEYPHQLERTITLKIPDGYTVKNPNDIKLNVVYSENGESTMGFTSDYTQDGNMLKIHVLEEYKKTTYPLSQYEDFKKVINAAADFNKIVLVLEKKS